MKNKIEHEPNNGTQQWVVYAVEGRKKIFRASFSTEQRAKDWIARYGDRDFQDRRDA